ncbi:60S ribosomal protein L13 [Lithohypha guttulata]|uniref:60S ribosomal protein L13 n=1 Tax=Lithohypha guttulata TaxID=1690604 RepID=UPI002DDED174|nr:60S ribosomal protein L13 [Lithohypha guttulata]
MAIKHNNAVPNNHFHKDWQRRVRVHFDQPGRKHRRRVARLEKAAKVAPRPVDRLRPVVQCPTIKYNRKARAGRGFTLLELKEAKIPRKLASTIGISVDPRRTNHSEESLKANVARLKAYQARLILFPRESGQHKKLDASEEQTKGVSDGSSKTISKIAGAFAVDSGLGQAHGISEVKSSDLPEGDEGAYKKLRELRSEQRYAGIREKRAKLKADAEESKKK